MVTYNQTGSEGTEVSITNIPNTIEAGNSANISFSVSVGSVSQSYNLDAEVSVFLYVNGENDKSIVASKNDTISENSSFIDSFTHVFPENNAGEGSNYNQYPRTDEPIWIEAQIDYYGGDGYTLGSIDEFATSESNQIRVTKPSSDPFSEEFSREADVSGDNTIASTFQNRTPFAIKQIEYEDDATYLTSVFIESERDGNEFEISFDYPNPTVAIDGSGRFAKHEIIGGSTVRQKIGEDPINISINGVCKRRTANQIDSLRDAKHGKIFSDRLPGSNDSLRVQFGSQSTEPMTDGGSADLTDGEYLYSFQINCIEVIR